MKNIGTIKLETERLILRKITINDAEQAFENWTNDPKTTRYLSWNPHKKIEVTKKVFLDWISQYNSKTFYQWVVEIKSTKQIIGTIGVINKEIEYKTAEVGYCYGSKFWNNGYGTEALKCVINFLINDVGFELIEAKHMSSNPASGKIMEKAGMKYETTLKNRVIDKITGERVNWEIFVLSNIK